MRLLTKPGGNAKLHHGSKGYAPHILHLAPAGMGGRGNICPGASPECIALCLNYSGRAIMAGPRNPGQNAILAARVRRTQFLFDRRAEFLALLRKEIGNATKWARKRNLIPVFRLNGTSDLEWSEVIGEFPNTQFYDYTKNPAIYHRFLLGKLPKNYHLTFSFNGRNSDLCKEFLARGGNVAVAFTRPVGKKYAMPPAWNGFPTVSGDESDLRFQDGNGMVIALKAKGIARNVKGNPFVVGS